MAQFNDQELTLCAAQRSQKLAVAGIVLGILPPLPPFPLYRLELLWIAPLASAQWEQCQSFYCSPAAGWERLGWLLVLGPSVLCALAAIICGYIGIKHWPRYPSERLTLFNLSLALGLLWTALFGAFLALGLNIAGSVL